MCSISIWSFYGAWTGWFFRSTDLIGAFWSVSVLYFPDWFPPSLRLKPLVGEDDETSPWRWSFSDWFFTGKLRWRWIGSSLDGDMWSCGLCDADMDKWGIHTSMGAIYKYNAQRQIRTFACSSLLTTSIFHTPYSRRYDISSTVSTVRRWSSSILKQRWVDESEEIKSPQMAHQRVVWACLASKLGSKIFNDSLAEMIDPARRAYILTFVSMESTN